MIARQTLYHYAIVELHHKTICFEYIYIKEQKSQYFDSIVGLLELLEFLNHICEI